MSIHYAVLGFKLTTYWMLVSSHKHLTSGKSYKHLTRINYNPRVIV